MKLIIDIPKEEYELVRHGNKSYTTELELMNAVANGVPVPKGHGDLIDRKDLIENGISKGFCDWYDEIKMADAIIEADTGETE